MVGKNVRGAYTEYCLATMSVVGGRGNETVGTDIGVFVNVSNSKTVRILDLSVLHRIVGYVQLVRQQILIHLLLCIPSSQQPTKPNQANLCQVELCSQCQLHSPADI